MYLIDVLYSSVLWESVSISHFTIVLSSGRYFWYGKIFQPFSYRYAPAEKLLAESPQESKFKRDDHPSNDRTERRMDAT